MEEEQKQADKQCEVRKKLSRTHLTFYIIGLFTVAIVLILISYVKQVHADEQLQNLSTQLNEQRSVAQGASQKMEDLQKQLNEQMKTIEDAKKALGGSEDLVQAAQHAAERNDALEQLLAVSAALHTEQTEQAQKLYRALTEKYSADRLDGTAENSILTGAAAAEYIALGKALAVDEAQK